jgi:hypothetical protein
MSEVRRSVRLPASAARVWTTIGDFNALPAWHPAVERSDLSDGGRTRTLYLAGGGRIVEGLDEHDSAARRYRYRFIESPLPIENYRSVLSVRDEGADGCTVEWQGDFTADDAMRARMETAVAGIYETGLENLRRLFGG